MTGFSQILQNDQKIRVLSIWHSHFGNFSLFHFSLNFVIFGLVSAHFAFFSLVLMLFRSLTDSQRSLASAFHRTSFPRASPPWTPSTFATVLSPIHTSASPANSNWQHFPWFIFPVVMRSRYSNRIIHFQILKWSSSIPCWN